MGIDTHTLVSESPEKTGEGGSFALERGSIGKWERERTSMPISDVEEALSSVTSGYGSSDAPTRIFLGGMPVESWDSTDPRERF